MLVVPAIILKLAREFLGLSQDEVEAHTHVSRSTIQRVERGHGRVLNSAVELQKFYQNSGIDFLPPTNGAGWGLINNNAVGDDFQLNKLESVAVRNRSVQKQDG